jgi:hypothetical protein
MHTNYKNTTMRCVVLLVLTTCSCNINAFIAAPSLCADLPIQTLRRAASGDINLETALANARANLEAGVSPGAGLATADEQADAAYADLILTSVIEKASLLIMHCATMASHEQMCICAH